MKAMPQEARGHVASPPAGSGSRRLPKWNKLRMSVGILASLALIMGAVAIVSRVNFFRDFAVPALLTGESAAESMFYSAHADELKLRLVNSS